MTSYTTFEQKFESKISIHDKRKKTSRFAAVVGLPESIQQAETLVPLAGGTPFETLFPFKEINIEYRGEPGKLGVKDSDYANDSKNKKEINIPLYKQFDGQMDIATGFQYQFSNGLPEVLQKTKQIVAALNKPGYEDWDTVLTAGSSDSLNKVFALLVDEETTVLCEEFTYPNVLHNCRYHGGKPLPLKMNITDDKITQGIDVDYLKNLLENFESSFPDRKKKLVLYTICTGHNPTALTQSLETRKEIYKLCLKHNVFIIEDDPYGYLQLPKFNIKDPLANPFEVSVTIDEFAKDLMVPSYITLDTEGIVLRLETFSKVVAPGLRLGFIVSNSYFTQRLGNINNMTNRNPSGASQTFLNNFLEKLSSDYIKKNSTADWADGWINWCMQVAGEYTHRRNVLFKALYETSAYQKNLFTLLEPSCGMFASIVVNLKPEYIAVEDGLDNRQAKINKIKRAMDYLLCCVLEAGTVAILGYRMTVSKEFSMERSTFMRITFAKASSEDEFLKGAKGLSDGIEVFFDEYMTDKERWNLLPAGLEGM